MSELTAKHGDKVASLYWKETSNETHEEEVIQYLKEACDIE